MRQHLSKHICILDFWFLKADIWDYFIIPRHLWLYEQGYTIVEYQLPRQLSEGQTTHGKLK